MALLERLRSAKKSANEGKGPQPVSPTVTKSEQPKYVHVPVHAAADSLNVIVLPAKADMREQVRQKMTGTGKFIAPRLKSNQTWSAGDLSIASILEQPLELSPARKSTRHSSFNSSNRRPPFRSSASLARTRSPLSNTIVEEDLPETADESPIGSTSSSDDGLEMKHDHSKLKSEPKQHPFAQSMSELVSDPQIETSESLQPNHSAKERPLDKVDSFLTMPTMRSSPPIMSQSQRVYADRSFPNVQNLPSIFHDNPPALDLAVKSSEEDWFTENSRVSTAFNKGLSEEIQVRAQQWQVKDAKQVTPPDPQVDLPMDPGPVLKSCEPLIELPSRSRRRSEVSKSFDSAFSAGRPEHEYIARQANAYNTVFGHLYPEGKSVASLPDSTRHLHLSQRLSQQFQCYEGHRRSHSVSPEPNRPQWNFPVQQADISGSRNDVQHNQQRGRQMLDMQARPGQHQLQELERRSHSSQRRVSPSPYPNTSDGTVHVSRYPSSRRASFGGVSPAYNEWESQYQQDYFPPQQDVQPFPSKPPPIPLASKPRFVPTYVQPHSPQQASLQRHHTIDVYSQTSQSSDPSFTNYSTNRISFTRHESYDSYTRASYIHDNRRSTAIDDRIAIAHMDASYRQSKTELTLDHTDFQSLSGDDHSHSYSDMSLFPQPPNNDTNRKLNQILGSEYRNGGPSSPPVPLSERPMLPVESQVSSPMVAPYDQQQSPMVTRLEYPPSPITSSRASLMASTGKKVLNMPRSSPRKQKGFIGLLRNRKSSGKLLIVN